MKTIRCIRCGKGTMVNSAGEKLLMEACGYRKMPEGWVCPPCSGHSKQFKKMTGFEPTSRK